MLKLIYAPDPILKKESVSIPQVDDHHRELIKQMYEIMYSANGVGLAAPQIGLNIRIFVLDAGSKDEEKKPITIITMDGNCHKIVLSPPTYDNESQNAKKTLKYPS